MLSPRGKLWQHTTIRELLKNPAYYGAIVWNRRSESKFYEVRGGRADKVKTAIRSGAVEKVSKSEWIVIESALPAIVDRPMWDRAQSAASVRADRAGGRASRSIAGCSPAF